MVSAVLVVWMRLVHCICSNLHTALGQVDEKQVLLHFLMSEIALELPPCLWVLEHVYRRGLGDFELVEMEAWGASFAFTPLFGIFTHGSQRMALLHFLMRLVDWMLPLACKHFSMYTEEAWIGSKSIGLFVWG